MTNIKINEQILATLDWTMVVPVDVLIILNLYLGLIAGQTLYTDIIDPFIFAQWCSSNYHRTCSPFIVA